MQKVTFPIPKALRSKYVSSKVSREIFFLDCINDLQYCIKTNNAYGLIRSSSILRMLLLDNCIKDISESYDIEMKLYVNKEEIAGDALSSRQVRDIKDLIPDSFSQGRKTHYLHLSHSPLVEYTLEEFLEKICLKMEKDSVYSFSVKNVIQLIANKHGGVHLETTFESSTMDSFMMGDFSPFSLSENNFFIEKIKEIIIILIVGVRPLCFEIIKKLEQHNKENIQSKNSSFASINLLKDD